jgi:hypothetical protein
VAEEEKQKNEGKRIDAFVRGYPELSVVRIWDEKRPIDRFQKKLCFLRALPAHPFQTDETVSTVVSTHARVNFDGNRYSVPADVARQPVILRADADQVRVFYQGRRVAGHPGSYDRGQGTSARHTSFKHFGSAAANEVVPGKRSLTDWEKRHACFTSNCGPVRCKRGTTSADC